MNLTLCVYENNIYIYSIILFKREGRRIRKTTAKRNHSRNPQQWLQGANGRRLSRLASTRQKGFVIRSITTKWARHGVVTAHNNFADIKLNASSCSNHCIPLLDNKIKNIRLDRNVKRSQNETKKRTWNSSVTMLLRSLNNFSFRVAIDDDLLHSQAASHIASYRLQ